MPPGERYSLAGLPSPVATSRTTIGSTVLIP